MIISYLSSNSEGFSLRVRDGFGRLKITVSFEIIDIILIDLLWSRNIWPQICIWSRLKLRIDPLFVKSELIIKHQCELLPYLNIYMYHIMTVNMHFSLKESKTKAFYPKNGGTRFCPIIYTCTLIWIGHNQIFNHLQISSFISTESH